MMINLLPPAESDLEGTLVALVNEVNRAHSSFRDAARTALEQSVECGLKLIEIKKHVQHGEFVPFVDKHFDFGIRTAQKYMSIAERFSLECKSELRALLSEAGIRTVLADGPGDQMLNNLATLSRIAGPDVLEDLVGSEAIASKSALKQLATMAPRSVKRVFEHVPRRTERKQRLEAAVKRSRNVAKNGVTLANSAASQQGSVRPTSENAEVVIPQLIQRRAQPCDQDGRQVVLTTDNALAKKPVRHPTLEMFDEVRHFVEDVVERLPHASLVALVVHLRRLADELEEVYDPPSS